MIEGLTLGALRRIVRNYTRTAAVSRDALCTASYCTDLIKDSISIGYRGREVRICNYT